MNILQGLQIQGLSLNTEENFNSIPGLWQWNDGRDRIEVHTSDPTKVASWGDKSTQLNNLTAPLSRAPIREKGIWVRSESQGAYLLSSRKDYRFQHNGAKFGIYAITKNSWSLGNPNGAFGAVNWGTATLTGLQGQISSTQNLGRYGYINRGTGSSPSRGVTGLLSTGSTNYSPTDIIYTQSFVNFGQDLGIRAQYGNAIANLAPFYTSLDQYPQGNTGTFYVCVGNTNLTVRLGLLLIYNWEGVSDQLVQEFDARVRFLLNKEKIIFENLDLL